MRPFLHAAGDYSQQLTDDVSQVAATMDEHDLTIDIAVSEETSACEWTLFMSGLLVGKGVANTPNELFTERFYENEMKSVKVSRYYQEKYCE